MSPLGSTMMAQQAWAMFARIQQIQAKLHCIHFTTGNLQGQDALGAPCSSSPFKTSQMYSFHTQTDVTHDRHVDRVPEEAAGALCGQPEEEVGRE